MAKAKGWTFNGISPVFGAYKTVNTIDVYGTTGLISEMGNPPEQYTYTGIEDLDIHKDTQTFVGVKSKYQGYDVVQVGSSFGLTGLHGISNNIKHGF